MALTVYQLRLTPKKPSFFDSTSKSIGELPLGTKILTGVGVAAGAVALAPVEGVVFTGALVTGATALLASGVIAIFGGGDDKIEIIDDATKLAKFQSYAGGAFVDGDFYVAHPKRSTILMVPSTFHKKIAFEQIAELISYLRSKLAITKLRIEVSSAREGEAGLRTPTPQGAAIDGGFSYVESRGLLVENDYKNPVLVPMLVEPVWLDMFPTIVNSVEGAMSGASTFQERQDMGFGLKFGFAERIGIDATWMATQNFTVRIEFGTFGKPPRKGS